MTKSDLKTIVKHALQKEYGFSPSIKNIVLCEASWDGTWVVANINGNDYSVRNGNEVERI